jgi:hypothetical protein
LVLTPLGNDLAPLLTHAKNGLGRHRNGGGVYDDLRILEATRRLLAEKPEVNIPDDNRYLVEAATHPARLEALQAELGEAWQSLAAKLEGDTSAEKTIGHLHTLNVEQEFGEEEFPTGVQVGTRLGAQDRVVHFDPATTRPLWRTAQGPSHPPPPAAQGLAAGCRTHRSHAPGTLHHFSLGRSALSLQPPGAGTPQGPITRCRRLPVTLRYNLLDEPLIRTRLVADGQPRSFSLPGLFVALGQDAIRDFPASAPPSTPPVACLSCATGGDRPASCRAKRAFR